MTVRTYQVIFDFENRSCSFNAIPRRGWDRKTATASAHLKDTAVLSAPGSVSNLLHNLSIVVVRYDEAIEGTWPES